MTRIISYSATTPPPTIGVRPSPSQLGREGSEFVAYAQHEAAAGRGVVNLVLRRRAHSAIGIAPVEKIVDGRAELESLERRKGRLVLQTDMEYSVSSKPASLVGEIGIGATRREETVAAENKTLIPQPHLGIGRKRRFRRHRHILAVVDAAVEFRIDECVGDIRRGKFVPPPTGTESKALADDIRRGIDIVAPNEFVVEDFMLGFSIKDITPNLKLVEECPVDSGVERPARFRRKNFLGAEVFERILVEEGIAEEAREFDKRLQAARRREQQRRVGRVCVVDAPGVDQLGVLAEGALVASACLKRYAFHKAQGVLREITHRLAIERIFSGRDAIGSPKIRYGAVGIAIVAVQAVVAVRRPGDELVLPVGELNSVNPLRRELVGVKVVVLTVIVGIKDGSRREEIAWIVIGVAAGVVAARMHLAVREEHVEPYLVRLVDNAFKRSL